MLTGAVSPTGCEMGVLSVSGLTVDFTVYSARSRSLRQSLMKISTGGLLLKNASDRVVVRALNNVSFEVEEGDRIALVGHNGSGKSTLLRTLAGIYAPSAGDVRANGRISAALDPMMGMEPEASGRENALALARYRGESSQSALSALPSIVEATELGPFLDLPLKTYSAGMIARLSFAVATSFQPDILLMDEWITAVDSAFVERARKRLEDYFLSARAVLLATHDHHLVHRLCNKVLVMEHGFLKAVGPPATMFAA